jgi:predicted trehalose synthase
MNDKAICAYEAKYRTKWAEAPLHCTFSGAECE